MCDPLCGSGTIAVEAALIAIRRAPGIARMFAFQRWPDYSARQWEHLVVAARKQERALAVRIDSSDQDAGAVAAARENAARAGVAVEIVQRRLADLPADAGSGLLACNPPYGVRVAADMRAVFRDLEEAARRRPRWRVAVIATRAPGSRFQSVVRTQNGGIPVAVFLAI
jgi:putative N6-adenine-specific DNA methylase